MATAAATPKGSATREMIIERAYLLACRQGLEGLSIGDLAAAAGMSKSGVFAHFGSREELQRTVLEWTGERFVDYVLRPALAQPRGLRRLSMLVGRWIDWIEANPDGCVFLGAAVEFDGRPGPMREFTANLLAGWLEALQRAVRQAIDTGELRKDGDAGLIAFEILSLMLGAHHARLFQPKRAFDMTRRAVERLFAADRA